MTSETQSETLHPTESHPQRRETAVRSSLAVYRFAQGYSQGALADAAGLARETVNRVEKGRTQPTLATVRALSRVLGREVEQLFPEVGS